MLMLIVQFLQSLELTVVAVSDFASAGKLGAVGAVRAHNNLEGNDVAASDAATILVVAAGGVVGLGPGAVG